MEINQNENRLVELTFIMNFNNLAILVPIIKQNKHLHVLKKKPELKNQDISIKINLFQNLVFSKFNY